MKQTPSYKTARRFRRTTWVLPVCLSLFMIPAYLFVNLSTTTPLTIEKIIYDWKDFRWIWLINLFVTYIPFILIGWIGGFSIYMNKQNIYPANGALYGLSIITALFWLFFGFISIAAPLDPGGYVQADFMLLFVIAPITGIASILIGTLIGFIYGIYRHKGRYGPKRKRRTTKTRSQTNKWL